jgi:hypothetical protein
MGERDKPHLMTTPSYDGEQRFCLRGRGLEERGEPYPDTPTRSVRNVAK